jgi:acetylornithine deacetylase/succinyl-diaminopimelate desuccinylase-like protein
MSAVTADEVIDLISSLVRIESVTPYLVPGSAGEAAVVDAMAEYVSDLPVTIEKVEVAPGRPNLIITLPGTSPGLRRLVLNAHADTVGYAGWPTSALVPRLDGDRLYGLGAADDKGCCAAALLALRALVRSGRRPAGDLILALVADEEGISLGTEHHVRGLQADGCIVLEADKLPTVVVEHQGFGWIDITLIGRAAHGSAPDAGIDAIVALGELLTRMHRHDREVFQAGDVPRNGRTVFHTGTVTGGTDYATYPSRVTLGIEIGTQPGEHLSDRIAEIEAMCGQVRELFPGLETEIVAQLDREPFLADGHQELLACLDRAAVTHLGQPLVQEGLNAWTDAALVQAAGIPTVLLGPLGGNFHAPDEWVSVPQVVSVVDVLVDAIVDFLG